MRAMIVHTHATLDTLTMTDLPDAAPPQPGEIALRLRARSPNLHDCFVDNGNLPVDDRRPDVG